jgi:hypothetical protein
MKSSEEVMEILEAYDLTGSVRQADARRSDRADVTGRRGNDRYHEVKRDLACLLVDVNYFVRRNARKP